MNVKGNFPDCVRFRNELRVVEYDWKPIVCDKCKIMGHSIEKCRWQKEQQQMKKKWVPKHKAGDFEQDGGAEMINANTSVKDTSSKQPVHKNNTDITSQDFVTFRRRQKISNPAVSQKEQLSTQNSFQQPGENEEGSQVVVSQPTNGGNGQSSCMEC